MPKVSIITPFKNAEKYICQTAKSIFEQSHSNWEWILIDDHSVQNESTLLSEFLMDSRVKLLQNNGNGITDALVTGSIHAKGDFITRMDADDIMPVGKLQLFLDTLKNTDTDVVTGKVRYFSDDYQISLGFQRYEAWLNDRVDHQDFYCKIYKECSLASGNWMMDRSGFMKIGGFENLNYPEDYDLLFRWYENKLKILGIDEVTHLWREHSERISKNSHNYGQERFFDLKINRFLDLDYQNIPLILNGTGRKGRLTALALQNKNISFDWVSIEPEKFGAGVYGEVIKGHQKIKYISEIQIINAASIEQLEVEKLYKNSNEIVRIITV